MSSRKVLTRTDQVSVYHSSVNSLAFILPNLRFGKECVDNESRV